MSARLCDVCNRPVATDDQWATVLGGEREDLCWGGAQCTTAAVDWHARALSAEAKVEQLSRELAEARTTIEGSITPPTDAEITAHAAAGGAWLVTLPARRGVRVATETRYTDDPKEVSRLWWSEGARWVAVLDGRPCTRSKVSDDERHR